MNKTRKNGSPPAGGLNPFTSEVKRSVEAMRADLLRSGVSAEAPRPQMRAEPAKKAEAPTAPPERVKQPKEAPASALESKVQAAATTNTNNKPVPRAFNLPADKPGYKVINVVADVTLEEMMAEAAKRRMEAREKEQLQPVKEALFTIRTDEPAGAKEHHGKSWIPLTEESKLLPKEQAAILSFVSSPKCLNPRDYIAMAVATDLETFRIRHFLRRREVMQKVEMVARLWKQGKSWGFIEKEAKEPQANLRRWAIEFGHTEFIMDPATASLESRKRRELERKQKPLKG